MKTAGVIFDFYDDPSGKILKEVFESSESLPREVKVAHILNKDERDILRDDAYALVMVNEGQVLRKFACVDPGNTLLSLAYFEKTAECLPDEAIQHAAVRLLGFCEEYGIEPTDLVKVAAAASGMSRERDSSKQPIVGDEADWASRTNLMSLRGGSDQGRVIPIASGMKTASAEDTSRNIGVNQKMPDLQNKTPSSTGLESGGVIPGPHPEIVNVTGKNPKMKIEKKASSRYALGDRYPLDSYTDVNNAVQYFSDYWKEMDPDDRHEYCVKTASRADELGIAVPYIMQRYGSETYAPDLEAYMASRIEKCASEYKRAYKELFEKRASVLPDSFAQMLAHVDSVAGMDRFYGSHIMDPWFSTFGGMTEKVAEESWRWKSDTGDIVTGEQLKWLAREGKGLVCKQFDKDLVEAFLKDPIQIFDSLPLTQKKILCNMANTQFDGPGHN